ncbi:MAG: alkaline phosphatase family protein [Candidatus Baldrarchaeia archaeon]
MENVKGLVERASFADNLFRPNYRYNVFKIVPTLLEFLELKANEAVSLNKYSKFKKLFEQNGCFDVSKVILFLVDSIGFEQVKHSNLISKLLNNGMGFLLSSVFPTITSTVITSIYTGLPPEKHGILGHKIFVREIGNIVDMLGMSTVDFRERDALCKVGVDVKGFLWSKNVFDTVRGDFVHISLRDKDIAYSGLSRLITEDRKVAVGYGNLIDLFSLAKRALEKYKNEKIFMDVYVGLLDDLAHKYGPDSEEYILGLKFFEKLLERFVNGLDERLRKETVVLICSDHGQVALNKENMIKFSEEDIATVREWLRIKPGKSGRVIHFYPLEEYMDELRRWLEEKIGRNGVVLEFRKVANELFPETNNIALVEERIGNLLVVCGEGADSLVEKEKEETVLEIEFNGSHGSLLLNELVVPVVFTKLDSFKNNDVRLLREFL